MKLLISQLVDTDLRISAIVTLLRVKSAGLSGSNKIRLYIEVSQLPSILVHYRNETIQVTSLQGYLRSVAWDAASQGLILVGNNGRVVRIEGEDVTHFVSGSRQHLRAISMNPSDDTALIVGNAGTVLL